jgi:hypothetical protein
MMTTKQRLLKISYLFAVTCFALSGCGGGSDSSGSATTGDNEITAPAPPADPGTGGGSTTPPPGSASAEPDGACTNFYAADAKLVVGQITKPWAKTLIPARGQAVTEANWSTCQVRVTDRVADGLGQFARNDYSRRQPFNADNSRQLIYALDGSWHIYDAKNYNYLKALPGLAGDVEPQWHHSDPDVLFYLPTNGVGMKLYSFNFKTNQSTLVADFAQRLKDRWPSAAAAWTKSEGSPSADTRYWCFMVDNRSWGGVGVFTWDRLQDKIIGMKDVKERPDHVSMSPSGKYCVTSSYGGEGVVAYSQDFSSSKKIANIGEHSDIGLDANGDDIYVSVDYQANAGDVYMVNLRTGGRTNLFATYLSGTATALHFSGKAYDKPGWFLMSSYGDGGGSQQWLHRKIVAVQMSAAPVVYNLADTRTTSKQTDGYYSEPHASVNRNFSKVVWNSNWNSSDADALKTDAFMVQIKSSMLKP